VLDRPYLRFELVMVNGPALKALIEKEFGDGTMSAIDFTMAMERVVNPNGDRVRLATTGNVQAYGLGRSRRRARLSGS
jgi:cyanate lyase